MKFKVTFALNEAHKLEEILNKQSFNYIIMPEADGSYEATISYLREDNNVGYVAEIQEIILEQMDIITMVDIVDESNEGL